MVHGTLWVASGVSFVELMLWLNLEPTEDWATAVLAGVVVLYFAYGVLLLISLPMGGRYWRVRRGEKPGLTGSVTLWDDRLDG